jgi:hypothetical protein
MARIDLIVGVKNAMKAGLAKAKESIAKFGAAVKNAMQGGLDFAKKLAAAVAVVGGAALAVGKSMVAQYNIQAAAEAKLESTLKATGFAAGFTAGELKEVARQLQKTTGVGDETIISMQGILATFKNIRGDNFNRATVAILDMGAAMGKAGKGSADVEAAVVQVGKALNDPIKGLSALSRVGVQFTESQKEQIAAMQEAGNIAGAQAVILKELESQFGGTAEAMAKAQRGTMQLKAAFGDVKEEIGRAIVETEGFDGIIATVTKALESLSEDGYIELWAENVRMALAEIMPLLAKAGDAFGWMKGKIQESAAFWGALAGGGDLDEAVRAMSEIPKQIEAEKSARLEQIKAERAARKEARAAQEKEEMERVQAITAIRDKETEAAETAKAKAEEAAKMREDLLKAEEKLIEDIRKKEIDAVKEQEKAENERNKAAVDALQEQLKAKQDLAEKGIAGILAEKQAEMQKAKEAEAADRKARELQARADRGIKLSEKDKEWLEAFNVIADAKDQQPLQNQIAAAQQFAANQQAAFQQQIANMQPTEKKLDDMIAELGKTRQLLSDNLKMG